MRTSLLSFCLIGILLSGCGNDRPPTTPVSGTITFNGGPPPAVGAIYFAPLSVKEGLPKRGGRAIFDTDGRYRATSFDDGDGLVPGTYRVGVECWKVVPTMNNPTGVSYIAEGFSTQNLTVESSRITHNVDIPLAE